MALASGHEKTLLRMREGCEIWVRGRARSDTSHPPPRAAAEPDLVGIAQFSRWRLPLKRYTRATAAPSRPSRCSQE